MNSSETSPQSAAVRQVLRGLTLNREPGWNFPGNFLELSFDEVRADGARLSLEAGPHLMDSEGEVSLGPVAVLADIGLAAAMRLRVGLDTRMATAAMSLQLTGAGRRGRLESIARFDGFVTDGAGRMGLARAEIVGEAGLVATASGSFMALGNRARTAPLGMRRRGEAPEATLLGIADLTREERAVYERAVAAAQPGPHAFIERFWELEPRQGGQGATCECENGLHVGNRVGHMQGGISFALGALTAAAAFGPGWRLVSVSAWYLSPGVGPRLCAKSRIVHEGRSTGVARASVLDAEGRTVIEVFTQHARLRIPSRSSATGD